MGPIQKCFGKIKKNEIPMEVYDTQGFVTNEPVYVNEKKKKVN